MQQKMKRVVIAGGGTAGWMTAATLGAQMGNILDITLIESSDIGTVGVGEATIPPMQSFHKLLNINEQEFMRATQGTFKMAIQFENWGRIGDSYLHTFGTTGREFWAADFQHFWLKLREQGETAEFGEYCLEWAAAKAGRFALTENPRLNYAYHLDATLYAKFLQKFSADFGVKHIDGKIAQVNQDAHSGYITSLLLEAGQLVEGDIFIDCTGFRGLLIEQTLQTGYDDWSHWLPANSALAVQTDSIKPAPPFTRSIAHPNGWQWQIPLQHRVGNGIVYSSRFTTDEEARNQLLNNIEGEMRTEPRLLRFTTGRRKQGWNKNVIAFGLASGFIEPLESTSIHMVMSGILRLCKLFPLGEIEPAMVNEYNQQARLEAEAIRDFIILHYKVTQRDDSEFWRYCRDMDIPESLAHKIELFKKTARVYKGDSELFRIDSWTQVMFGQNLQPTQYHPIVNMMDTVELRQSMTDFRKKLAHMAQQLPTHGDFVKQYCGT